MGNAVRASVVQEMPRAPIPKEHHFWEPPKWDPTTFPPYTFEYERKKRKEEEDVEADSRGEAKPRAYDMDPRDPEFVVPPGTPETSGPLPESNFLGVIKEEPEWLKRVWEKPAVSSRYFIETDFLNDELLKREIDHDGLRLPPNARHIRKLAPHIQKRIVEDYDNTINNRGDEGFWRNDFERYLVKNNWIPEFFLVPDHELRKGREFRAILYERLMEKHVDDPELLQLYHRKGYGGFLRAIKFIFLPTVFVYWICTSSFLRKLDNHAMKPLSNWAQGWASKKQQDFVDWYGKEGESFHEIQLARPPSDKVLSMRYEDL